jgi:hypothetical protein
MIYFYEVIEEEKPKAVSDKYGVVRILGKFHIKEHFNMTVVAEVYTKNMAEYIVNVLNEDSKKRTEEFNIELKKEQEEKQIEIRIKNGSKIKLDNSDKNNMATGISKSLLMNLHNRKEAIGNMALEQDLRFLWGDSIIDGLLSFMDFENVLIWLDEPNEWFDGMSPKEAVNENGLKCLDDVINHQMFGL